MALKAAKDAPHRIDVYVPFFKTLDQACPEPVLLDQDELMRLYRLHDRWRRKTVLAFLAPRLAREWNPQKTEAVVEARRKADILARSEHKPWASDLRTYEDHLGRDASLSPKAVRLRLDAASGLLAATGKRAANLRQRQIDRYVHRRPAHAAGVTHFLSCIGKPARLPMVAETPSLDPIGDGPLRGEGENDADWMLRQARSMVELLDEAAIPRRRWAILATAISKAYAVPLAAVVALKTDQVADDGATITLWPSGSSVALDAVLAACFRRWVSWDRESGYVFPGRNKLQPMSYAAVRHHLETSQGQQADCGHEELSA